MATKSAGPFARTPIGGTSISSCWTAKGQEVDRAKGIESGADDYITKPYSTRDLLKKVKGLLEPEEA